MSAEPGDVVALAAAIDRLTAAVSSLADSVNDLTVVLDLFDGDEPPPPGPRASVTSISERRSKS